jgi:hypothetical protein
VREHPLDAQVGESQADQGARPLGGVALVPRGPAQPVAQVDVGEVSAGAGTEVEPAQELSGGGGLSRPGTEPVEPVVGRQMEGDDLVPDLLAGCRPAAGEVAHDRWVAVQVDQVVHVVLGELAQGQTRCFQDDVYVCHEPRVCRQQSHYGRKELKRKVTPATGNKSEFASRYQ